MNWGVGRDSDIVLTVQHVGWLSRNESAQMTPLEDEEMSLKDEGGSRKNPESLVSTN